VDAEFGRILKFASFSTSEAVFPTKSDVLYTELGIYIDRSGTVDAHAEPDFQSPHIYMED
jgi:hypothetical protein